MCIRGGCNTRGGGGGGAAADTAAAAGCPAVRTNAGEQRAAGEQGATDRRRHELGARSRRGRQGKQATREGQDGPQAPKVLALCEARGARSHKVQRCFFEEGERRVRALPCIWRT